MIRMVSDHPFLSKKSGASLLIGEIVPEEAIDPSES